MHQNSHINLIKSAYPNYNWLPWKFKYIPQDFWNDKNNTNEYVDWLSKKLNIKSMEDWYKYSTRVNSTIKNKIYLYIKI